MSVSRFLILFLGGFFTSFSFAGPWYGPGNVEYGSTQEILNAGVNECLSSGRLNPDELEYYCAIAGSRMWQDDSHLYFYYQQGVKNAILGSANDDIPKTSPTYIKLDSECPDGASPDGTCLPPPSPDPKQCEVGDEITRPTYSPPGGSPTPSPQICSNQCLYDFDRRSSIGLEEPEFPGVGKYTAYYLGNGQPCTDPTPPETPPDPTEPPPPDPVDPTDPTDPDEPGGGSGGGGDGSGGDGGGGDGGGGDGSGSGGNGTGGGSSGGDGGGSGAGGGGAGAGDGDGDEVENTGTASGSCDTPPSFSGDPLIGAILHQQWLSMCYGSELKPSDVSSSLSEAGFTDADHLDGYLADNAENIDSKVSGIVSGVFTSGPSNSCPLNDDFISTKWGTIHLPWSMSCPIFNVISAVMFWFSYLAAGWILFNSLARSD